MEDVNIKTIEWGDKPPLIHRVSQPLLNERGIWIDADVTYNGLCHVTITTRLNLLRLRKPPKQTAENTPGQASQQQAEAGVGVTPVNSDTSLQPSTSASSEERSNIYHESVPNNAIFDSDAESVGSSSSDSDAAHADQTADAQNADGYMPHALSTQLKEEFKQFFFNLFPI